MKITSLGKNEHLGIGPPETSIYSLTITGRVQALSSAGISLRCESEGQSHESALHADRQEWVCGGSVVGEGCLEEAA